MEILQKIKNGSAFWPSSLTSGHIGKGTQNTDWKEHKHPYVHRRVIYNHQDMKAAQASISRWVDKTIMGHLHNWTLIGTKKKKFLPFVDSMDGPGEHYAKCNKPVRERQIAWFHSYMESNEQTELTRKMGTDS